MPGGWQVIAAYLAHRVASTRPQQPDPTPAEGIDAAMSEVFTTTDGRRFGAGQYEKIAARAERDRARGKARNKLRAVRERHLARAPAAAETGDTAVARAARGRAKAARIERHNLGRKKLTHQRAHDRAVTKDAVYQAVHDLGRHHCAYRGRGPVRVARQKQIRTHRQPGLCGLAALNSWPTRWRRCKPQVLRSH